MTDASPSPDPQESPETSSAPKVARARRWRDVWHVPAALLGVTLIVAGVLAARNTAPPSDFDGALDDADALIERSEFEGALGVLNEKILPNLEDPEIRPEHVQRFHLLRGDAVSLGQSDRMIDNRANHEVVVREYGRAEELLAPLGPDRTARLAESLLALDRLDAARRRIDDLPESHDQRRIDLLRRLVDARLARTPPERERALALLSKIIGSSGLSREARVWALARQAQMQLESGYPEQALEGLLRAMQRLDHVEGPGAGELYLLLAKAYRELGRHEDAMRQVERALTLLPSDDTLRAEALVVQGRLLQDGGERAEARDRYTVAVRDFPESDAWAGAMLGLAEVDARTGNIEEALGAYRRLVDELSTGREYESTDAEAVSASLLDVWRERMAMEDPQRAVEAAQLADRLFEPGDTPADVVLAMAEAHRAAAEQIMRDAGVDPSRPEQVERMDPVRRARARAHYIDAGEQYLRHARAVVLADDAEFNDSLWLAGESFDLAGETARTIEVLSEYAAGEDDDPRLPAALFKMAGAHQARGEFETAAKIYRELLETHPNSPEAPRAYVRLAQCRRLDGDESNDAEAEALLARVLENGRLTPEALEYRDALVQLGRFYLHDGRYVDAIERLSEAAGRYPDDAESELIRFQLADAYRLGAGDLSERLRSEAMPAGRRAELSDRREAWLESAKGLYGEVLGDLEAIDHRRRTDFQDMMLRNAHFYRADCAFDLGRYEEAITLYDAAAQRYADDPASLVAMVQIVNCYTALGRLEQARTANERARLRLRDLPPEALDAPDLPMERRHWEMWLDSSAELSTLADAGGENAAR